GEAAFEAALARAPGQVAVSPTYLPALYQEAVARPAQAPARDREETEMVPPPAAHARPDLSNAYVAPRSKVEAELAGIWQRLLGVAPIGVFDNFFELGGHSLLAIQLISRMRRELLVEVPVGRVFDAPTIADLAAGIEAVGTAAEDDAAARAEEILELVEGLSDGEVRALLQEERESDSKAGGGSAPMPG